MKNGRLSLKRGCVDSIDGTSARGAEAAVRPGRPHILSKYVGQTVLAIGAHPDDLELGIGGTLAKLTRAGANVTMAVVSIPNHLRSRREEAKKAAKILGCDIRLLTPNKCSRVEDMKTHELVGLMDELVREFKPAAMFTHCLANLHLDHKLVYDACMSSQRLRYFDLYCYSPTSCHSVNVAFHPQAFVDISDTFQIKMDAIRTHSSQFAARGLGTEHYKDAVTLYGRYIGVDYAEGLEIMRLRLT
ncbi:MAG: PIG-L family deacetylase [Elusimicrobia bacterium]|nr:PIG-L family deacetylase [Elusimicrobiota bacterium]